MLTQPSFAKPFGQQRFFESGGIGTAEFIFEETKYIGTAEFVSSLFLVNDAPDSPSGIEDTKNITPSIVKLNLSPENEEGNITIILQQYDAFYGDSLCLASLFNPEGAVQNETCGEMSISRPWVGGYSMDADGNPANQLAIDLGKKLYRFLSVGRLVSQKINPENGNLVINIELYLVDPRQWGMN